MTEHTPGPWHSIQDGQGKWSIASDEATDQGTEARHDWIANVLSRAGERFNRGRARNLPAGEAEANARLIAAAPALLEALEMANKYLGKAVADDLMSGCVVPVSRAFEITEHAIAQARDGVPASA